MRRYRHLLAVLMVLSCASLPAARAAAPERPEPQAPELGAFAVQVAVRLGLKPPRGGFTPAAAAEALRGRGISLRPEISGWLTEADVVTILNGLGYKVRTTTPSRIVTEPRAALLLEAFIPPRR
ncbi:MAG: hypothetical protein ACE5HU_03405 [Acidobacteriota bacterium]